VTVPFVDLHRQYLSIKEDIDAAIRSVIEESAFIRGRFVTEFEQQFATAVGVRRCVSCANGTDALYVAMRALGLRAGDEVITSAHSWISTSETITQAGGNVVFADTDPRTFTIDPRAIESKLSDRTVGIIPVHLYGQPADMDPILEIARKRGLWVIEDCAQAHMAEYKGRRVGTMGVMGTFSFYPGKNLGAMGDAGCLVTNDDRLADWSEMFARHGGKGEHVIEGINSRLDGIQAAILSVKLPHLEAWTVARRQVAGRYDHALAGLDWLRTPEVAYGRMHVYHLYVIRTRRRDALRLHLSELGVGTMLNYPRALPFYPAYSRLGHTPADFPNAYAAQDEILSLPMFPEMSEQEVDFVADAIRSLGAS
jgi:dTDP-4-amino-4,6-dideoxygalactose transaminase